MQKTKRNYCIRAHGVPVQDIIAIERQIHDWTNLGYTMIAIMYFLGKNWKISQTYEYDRTVFNVYKEEKKKKTSLY